MRSAGVQPTAGDGSQPSLPGIAPPVVDPEVPVDDEAERRAADARIMSAAALKRWLRGADLVAVAVGLVVAGALASLRPAWRDAVDGSTWLVSLAALPLIAVGAQAADMYLARANVRLRDECWNIVKTSLFAMGSLAAVDLLTGADVLTRTWAVLVFVSIAAALFVERLLARRIFARLRRRGRTSRRVLVVGTDSDAKRLAASLSAPEHGYTVVGHLSIGPHSANDPAIVGSVEEVELQAQVHDANGIVISVPSVSIDLVNRLCRRLNSTGLHVGIHTGLEDIDIERLRAQRIAGHAILYVEPRLHSGWRRVAKRVFDVTLSALLLLIAAPVIGAAALAIKLGSTGPVLFRQQRIGQDGRRFEMLKLRTMVVDAEQRQSELLDLNEADGPLFKIRDDPRITRVGRVLRKTSIDELPQFWNVIRGDMSVVGPRPALPHEVEKWTPELFDRLTVLPGITGLWQVSGRADAGFETYRRLDLYYVTNWSLVHDVMIVLRTIGAVLRGRGAG